MSRSRLLRLIRGLPETASPTPRVLGVDEFALRKGHVYATILVDIETRRPVDLLPDRRVETVARWLADHPGVEVICRDRSGTYAEAGRLGAPDAIHVADRWHLWKNLGEAVEKTVVRHRALLPEPPTSTPAPSPALVLPPDTAGPRRSGRLSDCVREQHAAVHGLLAEGIALRVIARQLGLARNTVRRLRAAFRDHTAERRVQPGARQPGVGDLECGGGDLGGGVESAVMCASAERVMVRGIGGWSPSSRPDAGCVRMDRRFSPTSRS
ncbi:transposase [Streptomyces sp. NPDC127051]|uniref:transposase n=1 Tax=Streptomyces sp. NPDC127051 TaxID=3347119 RepID=UPI003668BC12